MAKWAWGDIRDVRLDSVGGDPCLVFSTGHAHPLFTLWLIHEPSSTKATLTRLKLTAQQKHEIVNLFITMATLEGPMSTMPNLDPTRDAVVGLIKTYLDS